MTGQDKASDIAFQEPVDLFVVRLSYLGGARLCVWVRVARLILRSVSNYLVPVDLFLF